MKYLPSLSLPFIAVGLISCSSQPAEPSFGQRLDGQVGELSSIQKDWKKGESLIKKGRKLQKDGEAMQKRGRKAVTRGEDMVEKGRKLKARAEEVYSAREPAAAAPAPVAQ